MEFFLEIPERPYYVQQTDGLSNLPHLHGHIEIIYMRKGQTLAAADEKQVLTGEGDLYIAFPNQIHYYEDLPGEHDVFLIIASNDLCPEFRHVFQNYLPVSPVLKRACDNHQILSALDGILQSVSQGGKYADVAIKGNLLVLLSALLNDLPLEDRKDYGANLLQAIFQYCYENYMEDISLRTMSEELQVNHYSISRIFNERFHIGFRDYINYLRIVRACELLKESENDITDIAFAVGYNSIRTFNRCFRKLMKQTPRAYRQQIRQ